MIFALSVFLLGAGVWDVLIWNSIGMKMLGLSCIFCANILLWLSSKEEQE